MDVPQLRAAIVDAQRKLGELDGQRAIVATELRVLRRQLERAQMRCREPPGAAAASGSGQPAGAAPVAKAGPLVAIQPPVPLDAPAGADVPAEAAAPGNRPVSPPRQGRPRKMPRGVCPRCYARAHKMSGYRHLYVPPCTETRPQPGRAPSVSGSD
jgi:hypothetical protein